MEDSYFRTPNLTYLSTMLLLSPEGFTDYELIDSGNFLKLERFGKYLTIRPEPQAIWGPELPEKEWERRAHVRFMPKSSSSGNCKKLREIPDRWQISYGKNDCRFNFRLALTSFKHVGVFPEQAANWDFIIRSVKSLNTSEARVLNLFAYTGGASLAAKAAGADVTHLDSVRQVVTWAKENMESSGLSDIRWVVEDAMTFVRREVKRGKSYQGIILDPPAYGHGTDGQKWKLEEMIHEMVINVLELLDPKKHFLVLNTYSLGFSSLIIENLLKNRKGLETGELYLPSSTGQKLPLGVFGRIFHSQ
ncbi:MAG: class I SAM-dependent methyltransferase [Bacteroidota bacterium]